jgi:group I intron endonuclease
LRKLKNNKHDNRHLQNAWNKNGEKSFIFWIIEHVDHVSRLLEREQFYLDLFQSYQYGLYNIYLKAGSPFGLKRSEEIKKKLSLIHKGITHSEESKRKMSEAHKGKKYFLGKKHSNETRKRMSIVHKGHVVSDETRRKISLTLKGKNAQ